MKPTSLLAASLLLFCLAGSGQPEWISRFDSVMKSYERLNWNAQVIVGNMDSVCYERSIGFREVTTRQPFTPNTLFHTASVGKMFTSTRILQLVKAGKISLTQPVKSYVPDWNLPNLDKITVHHLLTHTSGLASAWDHPDYDFKRSYSSAEVKKMMEEVPLAFQTPGERFSYSNIGYTLLGEIIARTDKMSFERSISQYIFTPAGISTQSYATLTQAATPYYQVGATTFVPDEEMTLKQYKAGEGAGGWILTTKDLYRFLRAYLRNVYLDSSGQALQLTANRSMDSMQNNFRYGMALLPGKFATPHLVYGHNGGGKGFSVDAYFDPRTKLIVIMASNQYASSYAITRNLFRVLYQEPIGLPDHFPAVKVIEGIRQQGKDLLEDQSDSFFARINVPFTESILYLTYNLLDQGKDYATAIPLLAAGRAKFPQARYIWYNSGMAAAKLQQKEEAVRFFNKTKELASAANDAILLQQTAAQLKLLQKDQ